MKKVLFSLAIVAAMFTVSQTAQALTTLDGGFSCDGTTILKNDKVLTAKVAKNKVKAKLGKLKAKLDALKLAGAAKAKIDAAKAKIAAAKSLKLQLQACADGSLDVDIAPLLLEMRGTYTGTYVDGLVGSGPITLVFANDGTNFSGSLTIGGVFGTFFGTDPIEFHGDVAGLSLPVVFETAGTGLGDLRLTIGVNGEVDVITTTPPEGYDSISFNADYASGVISGTYAVAPLTSGSFSVSK